MKSHARRLRINRERQRLFCAGKETLEIPKYSDPAFRLCVGTRLLGSNNSFRHVHNGGLYTVIALGEEATLEDENGSTFSMSAELVARHTRLSWAITYPAVQGRTLEGSVGIWDLDSRHFTTRHLYVGLSRATDGALLSVY